MIAALIGVPLGLLASTKSRVSEAFMRFVDVFQAFPLLVLTITIVGLSSNREASIVVAIVLVNCPLFIRVVRAEALVVRSRRYVEAAVACGSGPLRVAFRHVLPNVTGVIFAQLSISTGFAIGVIATLGFLGIGVAPPTASWGQMVEGGSQYVFTGQWWVALFPCLAVLITIMSFNAVSDGLYALCNPRSRRNGGRG